MRQFTDQEERAALIDGARALRLNSKWIANRTDKPEPVGVATARAQMERFAVLLEEMADCYEVAS